MARAAVSIVIGALVWTGGTAAAQSGAALDEAERSIVRVVGDRGTGSGSVIAPGRVLTNHHVVAGQRTLAVVSGHTGGGVGRGWNGRPSRSTWRCWRWTACASRRSRSAPWR